MDRLLRPGRTGPRWFYQGTELMIASPRALRSNLSAIMENVFSSTPIINNEMIVRKKPTPTLINSRKKLLLGLLERHGRKTLESRGTFLTNRCSERFCSRLACIAKTRRPMLGSMQLLHHQSEPRPKSGVDRDSEVYDGAE